MNDQPKGSFTQAVKAVAWSFFGIRKSSGQAQDIARIKPAHLILVGLLGGAVFVTVLVLLVRWVVTSGVAQ
ncbi:DUF2970 domain-containing protein [Aquabacterium sp.]|uniref:DUF2970 domain-containing protein n=1 Tax=Aquabacterium sp. TaxID=1872578 RepID=UPI00248A718D|nr:DUF2970 domain-containing protein [Aquabacterium sp.]MDI1259685.1 DUF2970 domain-containing protein [Aquabacterium sp.]